MSTLKITAYFSKLRTAIACYPKAVLKQAGFTDITIREENKHYVQYNEDIVAHLKDNDYAKTFIEQFDEKTWHDAIEAYQLIADSIRDNELLIRNIRANY